MNSILKNEWLFPVMFCILGCVGVVQILRLGFSRYLLVLTLVQFCLSFALLVFRSLRRSKIFPGVALCVVLVMEVVRTWYRDFNPYHKLVGRELWGAALVGALVGLWMRIRDREWDRDDPPDQGQDITQLRIHS